MLHHPWMSWNAFLWWGGAAALAVLAARVAWRAVAAQRARRLARSFRPPAATELRWDTAASRPAAPPPGIPPDYADLVRRDAEEAAHRAAASGGADPPNPYPPGTPEFVLWVASYHLAMTRLDDTIPPPRSAPAPGAGLSPP
jgi:hypothetical protein